jgi:hypothetical protein
MENNGNGEFIFTPKPDKPESKTVNPVRITSANSWSFYIYNIIVNKYVGTTEFTITEHSRNDSENMIDRTQIINLDKFPHGFYAGNFRAEKTIVKNGDTVTLTWSGDKATYKILYGPDPEVVTFSDDRTWKSKRLTDTTNFILEVSHQEEGKKVIAYFNTTVMVREPSITVKDLTVSGKTSMRGDLTVDGKASMKGALTVKEGITDSGDLLVAGKTSMQGDLTVAGKTDMQGGMFGKRVQGIGAGKYRAKTDGIVIGWVTPKGDNPYDRSALSIKCSTNGYKASATGGHFENVYGDPHKTKWDAYKMPSSFCMPVKKDNEFELSCEFGKKIETSPSYNFVWIPIGSDSDVTLEEIDRK